MEKKIENLENLDLSGWSFDIDLDSLCEKAVKCFLSETPIEAWMPSERKSAMTARVTLIAAVNICDKMNPYVDIDITSFLSEEIEAIGDYLRCGEKEEKGVLETMKADMLSLINQIDGELLKYEQANTKD